MSNDNARNNPEQDNAESRPYLKSGVYKTLPKEDDVPNPLIGKALNFIRISLIVITCIAFSSILVNTFLGSLTERILSLVFSLVSFILLIVVSILYDKYK
jgi:hypothetical protein